MQPHSIGGSEKIQPPDSRQSELQSPSEHKTSSQSPTLFNQSNGQAQHPAEDPSLSDSFSPELQDVQYGTPVDLPSHSNANNNNSTIKSAEAVSPYVAQMLANMPPVVQANDDGIREGETDEQARRRVWREEKRAALEQELEKAELLLKAAKASGSSKP